MFEIQGFDSGVPSTFVTRSEFLGRKTKYPIGKLKVGQWFFVPEHIGSVDSLRSCAKKASIGCILFKVKKVQGGCEVHRIY